MKSSLPNHVSYSVFVGDLAPNVTEKSLIEEFQKFGEIESARVVLNKRFGFVNFKREDAKARALRGQQRIQLSCTVRDQGKRGCSAQNRLQEIKERTCLFVGNLPDDLKDKELRGILEEIAGTHLSVRIKGCFCFVTYETHEEAKVAMENLKKSTIQGRKPRVQFTSSAQGHKKRYSTGNVNENCHDRSIIIRNLPVGTTRRDIELFYMNHGRISRVCVMSDRARYASSAAFVEFRHVYDAVNALQYSDGKAFKGGRVLDVCTSSPKLEASVFSGSTGSNNVNSRTHVHKRVKHNHNVPKRQNHWIRQVHNGSLRQQPIPVQRNTYSSGDYREMLHSRRRPVPAALCCGYDSELRSISFRRRNIAVETRPQFNARYPATGIHDVGLNPELSQRTRLFELRAVPTPSELNGDHYVAGFRQNQLDVPQWGSSFRPTNSMIPQNEGAALGFVVSHPRGYRFNY